MQGPSVRRVQEWVTLRGMGLAVDGVFGAATEAAVRAFQQSKSLPANGVVDDPTFAALTAPLLAALAPIMGTGRLGADATMCAQQHLAQHPREVGGPNAGPWVRTYMKGNEGVEFPWCAGFACFMLAQANGGRPLPFVASFSCDELASEAWRKQLFRAGGEELDTATLAPGSLFLVRRPGGGWHHTGIVIGTGPGTVTTIEGNTNDVGSSEGFEVCRRVRATAALDFIVLPG
jgi:Putative peptidoglycan binding domain/CHAP domain